jgi:Do/DeqQ family serine protease
MLQKATDVARIALRNYSRAIEDTLSRKALFGYLMETALPLTLVSNRSAKRLVVIVLIGVVVFVPQAGQCIINARENAVVRAVRDIGPAVVNISSQYELTQRSNPFFDFGLDPFFDSFFRDFFEPRYRHSAKGTSLGSGVIVDGKQGFILTNEHVIARSAEIKVVLQDGLEFRAELVGAAPDFDLAVLKIETQEPLPDIEMGDSKDILIGETVIAIGNPFGFSHTVTTGVVSALYRTVKTEDRTYRDFIQTDASINPGNSGGPLVNINGDLIGITTAIYSKAQGIGFAIPINRARRVMEDIIRYGEVHFPWLGLFVQDLDPRLSTYFNAPEGKGVLVSGVIEDSPAQRAGMEVGDIIIGVGRHDMVSKESYVNTIRDYSAGDTIPLVVWKDGTKHSSTVRSTRFPDDMAESWAYAFWGLRVEEITAASRLQFRIVASQGVMVSALRPGCYLESIGAQQGDVVRKINEIIVTNKADFDKAVAKYRHKDAAVLVIQRGGHQYYVTVKLGA